MAGSNLLGGASLNFKDRNLVVPSAIIVVSLAVLAAALLFGVFAPPPSVKGVSKQAQLNDLNREIGLLKTQQQKDGRQFEARLWQGSQNDVSAAILAALTARAKQDGLAISSFRPQRTTDLTGVTELPFAVQISGPYPGVRQMMSSLDTSSTKVVLRSVQITAATNSTTDVSATLGLSAYLATDPVVVAAVQSAKQPPQPSTQAPATAETPAIRSASAPRKGVIAHGRS